MVHCSFILLFIKCFCKNKQQKKKYEKKKHFMETNIELMCEECPDFPYNLNTMQQENWA